MGHDYFAVNPGNEPAVINASNAGKAGAPHKIALSLANLPKRKDNAGATWPRTPSKIDPQVSHFPVRSPQSPRQLIFVIPSE